MEPMDAAREALTRARRTARDKGLRPGAAGRSRRRGGPATTEPGADGRRDPQLLGAEVDRLVAGRGWAEEVQVGGVVGRWRSIVGDQVAANVEVVAFEGRTLTVRARSTAWATQMRLLTSTVLGRIEELIGEDVVDEIVVQGPAGPHWRKGPLSSGGRGPRDTYG
ncbi:Zn-ribbon RNA-binding protein [Serinicoccus hydrothermalis]|uniref:Zn-ribbon RNA-binding protein n=2 Tax=Serinicoccus hydrothermalis TaxID=1758689 RepID=A0A1B1NCX9_9MICO|nr:Zn-ribbon RNA-binding protein [Serinicoccus hydrothermalis]